MRSPTRLTTMAVALLLCLATPTAMAQGKGGPKGPSGGAGAVPQRLNVFFHPGTSSAQQNRVLIAAGAKKLQRLAVFNVVTANYDLICQSGSGLIRGPRTKNFVHVEWCTLGRHSRS